MVDPGNWKIHPPRRSNPAAVTTEAVVVLSSEQIKETTALPPATREEVAADSWPIEVNHPANFAPNEIAIGPEPPALPPDIAALIGTNDFEDYLRLANRPARDTLYVSLREKLTECLSLAYVLYLHVLLDPDKLKRLFEAPYFSESRKRSMPRKKVALAALQYVTQPETEEDRKSASAYSTMLIYARHKGVTAQRFSGEMADVTLLEAKTFVRDLSRENAPKLDNARSKPSLTITYRNGTTCCRRVLAEVYLSADERLSLAEEIVKILHEFQAGAP
jgi:hypothetical protein